MERKTNWLKTRREALHLKQEDLAAQLQVSGFDISRPSISHWENGRHLPPLENPEFRQALANILRIDVKTLLKLAGYEVAKSDFSEAAERVAYIVDQLPPDKQELAVRLVEQLAKN